MSLRPDLPPRPAGMPRTDLENWWGVGAEDADAYTKTVTRAQLEAARWSVSILEALHQWLHDTKDRGRGGGAAPARIRYVERCLELMGT
jgi:hypothetical protein